MKKINCNECKHFYVTWDNNHPKGCKAYGIKSKFIPSQIVQDETEEGCLAFEMKKNIKKSKELNLNDDDLW